MSLWLVAPRVVLPSQQLPAHEIARSGDDQSRAGVLWAQPREATILRWLTCDLGTRYVQEICHPVLAVTL